MLMPLQARFAGIKLSAHGGEQGSCGRCIQAACADAAQCSGGAQQAGGGRVALG